MALLYFVNTTFFRLKSVDHEGPLEANFTLYKKKTLDMQQ